MPRELSLLIQATRNWHKSHARLLRGILPPSVAEDANRRVLELLKNDVIVDRVNDQIRLARERPTPIGEFDVERFVESERRVMKEANLPAGILRSLANLHRRMVAQGVRSFAVPDAEALARYLDHVHRLVVSEATRSRTLGRSSKDELKGRLGKLLEQAQVASLLFEINEDIPSSQEVGESAVHYHQRSYPVMAAAS